MTPNAPPLTTEPNMELAMVRDRQRLIEERDEWRHRCEGVVKLQLETEGDRDRLARENADLRKERDEAIIDRERLFDEASGKLTAVAQESIAEQLATARVEALREASVECEYQASQRGGEVSRALLKQAELILALATAPAAKPAPDAKCGTCHGSGRSDAEDKPDVWHATLPPCRDCDGTGALPRGKRK